MAQQPVTLGCGLGQVNRQFGPFVVMNADRANAVGVVIGGRRDRRELRTIDLRVVFNGNVESRRGLAGENRDNRRCIRLGRVGGDQVHRQIRRQDKRDGHAADRGQYAVALSRL